MPSYDFRCPACGRTTSTVASIHHGPAPQVCSCGSHMRRVFHAPSLATPIVRETHFNHAVGEVVGSDREFRSALARRSDEASERMGYDVKYEPVSPDAAPPETADARRKHDLRTGAAERRFMAS